MAEHGERAEIAERSDAAASSSVALVSVAGQAPARRGSAELIERTGQAALGLTILAADSIRSLLDRPVSGVEASVDDRHDPLVAGRRIALGLAVEARRATFGVAEGAVRVASPFGRWLVDNPLLQPVGRALTRSLDAAYERGRSEEEAAREVVARTAEETVSLVVPVVLANVDLDSVVEEVLEAIDLEPVVDRVLAAVDLKPVIDRVLAELDLPELVEGVLAELDLDPIVRRVLAQLDLPDLVQGVLGDLQMSSVVLDATGGVTNEILSEIRERSAHADGAVERAVGRVLRRRLDRSPPRAADVDTGGTP